MNSSFLTATVLGGIVTALYLLPALIAWIRRAPDIGTVAVINIFLGWTFLGWVAALAMALRTAHPAGPSVHLEQHLHQSPPPDGPYRDAWWSGPPGPPTPRQESPPPLALPPRSHDSASPPWQPSTALQEEADHESRPPHHWAC